MGRHGSHTLLAHAGLKGFNATRWHGLHAPGDTARAVLDQLNAALRRCTVGTHKFIKRKEALGAAVIADKRHAGAEHRKFVAALLQKRAPPIRTTDPFAD